MKRLGSESLPQRLEFASKQLWYAGQNIDILDRHYRPPETLGVDQCRPFRRVSHAQPCFVDVLAEVALDQRCEFGLAGNFSPKRSCNALDRHIVMSRAYSAGCEHVIKSFRATANRRGDFAYVVGDHDYSPERHA